MPHPPQPHIIQPYRHNPQTEHIHERRFRLQLLKLMTAHLPVLYRILPRMV